MKLKQSVSEIVSNLSLLAFLLFADTARAGGLSKATGVLEGFKSDILVIVPIVAFIALVLFGVGYATKFVEKDTFVRWGIGIVIAGSAAEIVAAVYK